MIYIHYQEIDGIWYAVALDGEKVFATAFSPAEKEVLQHLLGSLSYNMSFQIAEEQSQLSIKLLKTLKAIFDGNDADSRFKMAMNHLSSYAQKVLHCVSLIPAGYVTTYGAIAKAVGGSPRAVGRVMASNPFPLVIPCHRVVRTGFSIGGYGLGQDTKRGLLRREDHSYKEATKIKVNDRILPLFPVRFLRKDWKLNKD